MVYNLNANLAVAAMACFFSLCCVSMTSTDQGMRYVMFEDKAPVSLSATISIQSSTPIDCARDCLRRNSCLAFSISSSTCSLYDTYMSDPTTQLVSQPGQDFFSLVPKEKVSVTTEDTGDYNSGKVNFFPQLRINRAGRVLSWQVRCGRNGIVVLTIWRGEITSSIILVGKHYITVPEGMQNQLVTYDVPVEETVLVEADDFVGFHYVNDEREAKVQIIKGDQTPEGVAIGKCYFKSIQDDELNVGTTIEEPQSFPNHRVASLAVYIA